jgi:uncharacterized protein YxjI
MALVHKALMSPLRERWKIDVEDGPDLEAQGNVVDHEYEIEADGRKVAHLSKRWSACETPTAARWQPTRTRRCCSPSR